jgi:hypothetical protein
MTNLTSLAGSINKMSSSLQQLGVDIGALQVTAGAFQLIGGTGQVIKGLIAAKEAYNAIRLAEGTAHLAKYTVGAGAVAALAVAGGAAMGMMIERAINTDDSGQGMRSLAGGYTNGRY